MYVCVVYTSIYKKGKIKRIKILHIKPRIERVKNYETVKIFSCFPITTNPEVGLKLLFCKTFLLGYNLQCPCFHEEKCKVVDRPNYKLTVI